MVLEKIVDWTLSLQQTPSLSDTLIHIVPIIIVVFLIFYFIVILPSSKEEAKRKDAISKLKKGDQILLSNGFLVRFVQHEDPWTIVELSSNVRAKVDKNTIQKVIE
ncbi:MAG: preprotein translocase subunit YajC [Deltaproteobacteria bacterium]|nr:preprotein translocase subunit YajC [Deltaproteobacteria bacterium]